MRRRARRTAATLVAVTAVLALGGTAGCATLDRAMDCVKTADAIATSVDRLSTAVSTATDDPTRLAQSLDDIDQELNTLKNSTGDADLAKAVEDLRTAVTNVRTAADQGDTTPDISGVTGAAAEITKVCAP
ncbi:hypothetical protein NX801_03105 [Streptomyces sp. LP05-1]|uniref:Secreted protein n=1 Tax=Streptomyces pyxinae TaxID=2970734 RepID=A0ABT2CB75_9ACTN|nr:hypothetical protein [Streptomyces sp. LP05-1]MCS0634661.1 hypothetical protein [Streptomyces sp. LP05-1]